MMRNQQQLILVKQLYEDSLALSGRSDALSLTKAIVLLDLAVELLLNNIVLNLDPDFTVNETRGSEDIARKTLWGNAARAARVANKGSLPETREIANLHALRNLVQHSGTQPSQSETERYFAAVQVMFSTVFENVYGLNFSRLQIWDLVASNDLREWLRDSEVALSKGNPEICIAGCNYAHDLIIGAIRHFTKLRRFRRSSIFSSTSLPPAYRPGMSSQAIREIEGMAKRLDRELRAGVEKFRSDIMNEIEFLEDEVVAIGVGLPLMDTRRFQKIGSLVYQAVALDGTIHIQPQINPENFDEARDGAGFMLSYLSRLIRLLEEAYPGVLTSIQITLPLKKQSIWQAIEINDSDLNS
jgi:hypothetical protein